MEGEDSRKIEGRPCICACVPRRNRLCSDFGPNLVLVCTQARAPTAGRSLQVLEVVVQVLAARGGACGPRVVGREGVSKDSGFISNLGSFALVVL